jgi:RNA polymerase sigma-70 factor (ECF subfamily)
VTEPSDSELLHRSRQGDAISFAALVRRHDRYVYRLARSVLTDDDEAEDVAQSTFIQAFTGLDRFRGEASLRTWLARIALNEATRRRRQSVRLSLAALEEKGEREHSQAHISNIVSEADPERAAARSQIRERLEQVIDDLSPGFRSVLILRDVEEVSGAETAHLLGIRPETVRTRLHRARRMLRKALGEQMASALKDTFPFEGARCESFTRRLLQRLALAVKKSP